MTLAKRENIEIIDRKGGATTVCAHTNSYKKNFPSIPQAQAKIYIHIPIIDTTTFKNDDEKNVIEKNEEKDDDDDEEENKI